VNPIRIATLFSNVLSAIVFSVILIVIALFFPDLARTFRSEPEDTYVASALSLIAVIAVICSVLNVRLSIRRVSQKGLLAANLTIAICLILMGFADWSSEVSDARWFLVSAAPFILAAYFIHLLPGQNSH
jgi:hypothetical protein